MSDDKFVVQSSRTDPLQIDRALVERDGAKVGTTAIAVYAALCTYIRLPQISPSHTTIGTMLGITRNTVKAAIEKLIDYGWIKVETRYNPAKKQYDTSVYILLPTPPDKGVGQKLTEGRSIIEQQSSTPYLDDLPEIDPLIATWEAEARQAITPNTAETLFGYANSFGKDTTIEAIKEAAATTGAGQFTLKYVLRILESWQRGGKGNKPSDDTFHSTMREV